MWMNKKSLSYIFFAIYFVLSVSGSSYADRVSLNRYTLAPNHSPQLKFKAFFHSRTDSEKIKKLQESLAYVKEAKKVLLWHPRNFNLGEEVSVLSSFIASLLLTAPNIQEILIISEKPGIFSHMDSRVKAYHMNDIDSSNPSHFASDMVINFAKEEEFPSIIKVDKEIHNIYGLLAQIMLAASTHATPYSFPRTMNAVWEEFGLTAPDFSTPLFKQSDIEKGHIFINPHGRTNQFYGDMLASSWHDLVIFLLDLGYTVTLNGGISTDPKDNEITDKILEGIQSKDYSGTLNVFRNQPLKNLTALMSKVEHVITIDTGIYHISKHFGTKTLVVTTARSEKWVTEDGSSFLSDMDDFKDDPIKAFRYYSTWLDGRSEIETSPLVVEYTPQLIEASH